MMVFYWTLGDDKVRHTHTLNSSQLAFYLTLLKKCGGVVMSEGVEKIMKKAKRSEWN